MLNNTLPATPEKTAPMRVEQSMCQEAMRRLDDGDAQMRNMRPPLRPRNPLLPRSLFN
jgi:hypothetical protein